jgi:transcriptional regulator with XRE-family HTH domain/DNA polymerase III delta prime subunit
MNETPNEKLRNARRERGWTQSQLADELSVGESTIRSWERGTRSPSLIYRQRICTLFQMTPEELGLVLSQKEQETDQSGTEKKENNRQEASLPQEELQSTTFPSDDENRSRMLNRVQSRWISGFLDLVSGTSFITLKLLLRPDAIASPWRAKNQEPYSVPSSRVSDTHHITEVYDEADGELLILGEPGAGKTTLLLELTRELLKRCQNDLSFPIPVIFHLAGWAERMITFELWLAEELNLKYQIPLPVAQKWIEEDEILPLLDGLDEVEQTARPACVDAINTYRQKHGFLPMVVCCRTSDYSALPTHLVLGMAVEVQPLTSEQIDSYISKSGQDLVMMEVALKSDPGLYEVVSTPLMLNILAYNAQEMSLDEVQTLQSSRYTVFEQYITRLLRKEATHTYPGEKIKHWLSWLAWQMTESNQVEFHLERLQPVWLNNGRQHYHYRRTVIWVVMLLQCILGGALVAWLKGGLKHGVVGSGNGILGLFGGGSGNSMLGWMAPGIGGGSQGGASLIIILAIVTWLVTILVGNPSLPNLTLRAIRHGLFSGVRVGLILGVFVSVLAVPFFSRVNEIHGWQGNGILYGLGIGFFLGIVIGLLSGLDAGLRYEQKVPKQSTLLRDRALDGFILGCGGALGFAAVEEVLQVSQESTLIYSGVVFLFYFIVYGFGGGTSLFSSLMHTTIQPSERVSWSWSKMSKDMPKNATRSLILAIVTCVSVGAAIACMSSFFFNIPYGLHYGAVFGSISGLIVGTAALLTGMITSSWSSAMIPEDQHIRPNEGITFSAQNALLGAFVFALLGAIASGIACWVGFGIVGGLMTWTVMAKAFAVMFAILFFLTFALAQGGIAWIQHYVLRLYLWRNDAIPFNSVRFLDTAVDYSLLRKVGGGYMFTHHLMMDHFVQLYRKQKQR